jgi:hypothetical protein
MTRRILLIVVPLAISCALVASWWIGPAPAPAPAGLGAAAGTQRDPDLARITGRLAALEQNTRMWPPPAGPVPAPAPAVITTTNEDRADQPSGGDDAARFARRLDQLEGDFQAQASDPQWRSEAETSISSALKGPAFGRTLVQAAECRTSICRLQVSHGSQREQDGFLLSFLHTLAWNTNTVTRTQPRPDGRIEQTIYLSRAGRPLPQILE